MSRYNKGFYYINLILLFTIPSQELPARLAFAEILFIRPCRFQEKMINGNSDKMVKSIPQPGRKRAVKKDMTSCFLMPTTMTVVQETINVGTETAAALKAQTEQMSRVVDELDSIHFSLKKASQLVKEIGRQLVHTENKDIGDIPGLAPPEPKTALESQLKS